MEFIVFQFVPIVHSLGITEKSLAAPSLHPSIRYLGIFTRSIPKHSSALFVFILLTNFSIKYFDTRLSGSNNCSSANNLSWQKLPPKPIQKISPVSYSRHFCSQTVHPFCKHKHLRSYMVKLFIHLKTNPKKSHFPFVMAELFLQSSSPLVFIRDTHLVSI